MIVGAGLYLTPQHSFPGLWALLPTIGTALLILAGEDSAINRFLLGNKLLVGVGLISYPLYLWHWPLLVFARKLLGEGISGLQLSGVVAMAFLLAYLTYEYVERPVRFEGLLGRKTTFWLSSAMLLVLFAGISAQTQIQPSRLARTPLGREVEAALNDWEYPFRDNFMRLDNFIRDTEIGAETGLATLFVGDSHMQQYWPRVKSAIEKAEGCACPVILITAPGTPVLPDVDRVTPGYACSGFFQFAVQEACKTNVGTVVLGCRWQRYFDDDSNGASLYLTEDTRRIPLRLGDAAADKVFKDFGRTIADLVDRGRRVYVILSSPEAPEWSPANVSRLTSTGALDSDRLGVSREQLESRFPVERKLAEAVVANGGRLINPRETLEEGGFLFGLTAEGKFRYRDGNHLRPFYVREKASFIDALVQVQ
jgi:hypothetical protein